MKLTDLPIAVQSTAEVRDIWVDFRLVSLPILEGVALVPAYQAAFDRWLSEIKAEAARKAVGNADSIRRAIANEINSDITLFGDLEKACESGINNPSTLADKIQDIVAVRIANPKA